MKNSLSIFLFITTFSFSQNIEKVKINKKPNYSESSKIRVFYKDSLNEFHPNQKPVGVFINGKFIGEQSALLLNDLNIGKVEEINIEKKIFEKNGVAYFGKIFIEMKPNYKPNFLTLNELFEKHLQLDTKNPLIYQINENVLSKNCDECLIDENFILKITIEKIKTSEKNVEINLIKLITKTPENIKKANEIRIRGAEINKFFRR